MSWPVRFDSNPLDQQAASEEDLLYPHVPGPQVAPRVSHRTSQARFTNRQESLSGTTRDNGVVRSTHCIAMILASPVWAGLC